MRSNAAVMSEYMDVPPPVYADPKNEVNGSNVRGAVHSWGIETGI